MGSDADFLVYDPDQEATVRTANWISRARASARLFEGHSYRGQVKMTFVRGNLVYASGKVVGSAGYGRMVRPHRSVGVDHPPALAGAASSAAAS